MVDHYQTEEEKLFIAEYGSPYDTDTPLDPLQRERREMLQKQAALRLHHASV